MNIVLIGIQGSGKGTLVSGLEQHINFSTISTGQLLREEVATGSALGQQIKQKQDAGQLVDMAIVVSAIKKKLESDNCNIKIFDGFPRNIEQAKELDKISKVDLVVYLNITKEIAIDRLLTRLTCSKCGNIENMKYTSSRICSRCGGELAQRSDDSIESINRRFAIFETETLPLLEYYRDNNVRVETINALEAQTTLDSVLKVLNEYNN